jgi:hypothetical protein
MTAPAGGDGAVGGLQRLEAAGVGGLRAAGQLEVGQRPQLLQQLVGLPVALQAGRLVADLLGQLLRLRLGLVEETHVLTSSRS